MSNRERLQRQSLLRTIKIFKETDNNTLYEQITKTLAEPIVINAIKSGNNELINHPNPIFNNWRIINRGGDAINYYYPINQYYPTNDWDLGLMPIPYEKIMKFIEILEFQKRIMKIMEIIKFHAGIMKIMQILEFYA